MKIWKIKKNSEELLDKFLRNVISLTDFRNLRTYWENFENFKKIMDKILKFRKFLRNFRTTSEKFYKRIYFQKEKNSLIKRWKNRDIMLE